MKRKWWGIILILVVLIGFTKIYSFMKDEKQSQNAEAAGESDDLENMQDLIVVGFSQIGAESDWRVANTESFKTTFTEENGYYLLYEDAQQKQENQIKAIRNFILQEVDYIVCAPIVESGWESVLEEAKEAGIPVILTDRMVNVEDESLYTCWVGCDFEKEGENAALWLKQYLESKGRSKERINIVTLQGTLGASAQIGRTQGFAKVLKSQKNWKMMEMQSGDFTQAKGQEMMEYFLDKYKDIDVLISENDNMTFGAIEAIKKAGKTCGDDGEIIVVSFDAVYDAFKAMTEGDINVCVECNPLSGPTVANIIEQLEAGEIPEKIVYMNEGIFTAEDAAEYIGERTY